MDRKKKAYIRFRTIHDFRHPLGMLEYIPAEKVGTTLHYGFKETAVVLFILEKKIKTWLNSFKSSNTFSCDTCLI